MKQFFNGISIYENWQFFDVAPGNIWLIISFLISGFTFSPISEELFFRGFLYNALKSRLPILPASLIQASIFALIHPYRITGRIEVFLMGIALVIVYERRKSLLAPVCVHGLGNAVIFFPLIVLLIQNYHVPAAT